MAKKKVELFQSLMVGVILRYDTVGRYSDEGVDDFLNELEDYLNHAAQGGHIFADLFLEGDTRKVEALGADIPGFNMKQSRLLDFATVFFFELPHLCTKTECATLADVVASLVENFCVRKVASATLPPAGRADFQKAVLGTAEGRTESFKRDMAKTGALPNPPTPRFKNMSAEQYARDVVDAMMKLKGYRKGDDKRGWKSALNHCFRVLDENSYYFTKAWEAGDRPAVTAKFLWELDVDKKR